MLFLLQSRTLVLLVFCVILQSVTAGYVVTFPRKWVAGARTQICLGLDFPPGPDDGVTLEVVDETGGSGNIDIPITGGLLGGFPVALRKEGTERDAFELVFGIPVDSSGGNAGAPLLSCEDFEVPAGLTTSDYGSYIYARVTGSIGGVNVSEIAQVFVIKPIGKVFLQTDKELYKAGQIVQFRLLTLKGVYMDVSTEPYSEIFVESPSGSRIAQWLDVPNPSGLIHRELQLLDEPEEGTYRIVVRTPGFGDTNKFFQVEEYVLPRFEVTVAPPPYFLATDETLDLKVCAQYTFGQPVRGSVSINIGNTYSYHNENEVNYVDELVGCELFEIPVSSLINSPNSYWYSLQVKIEVEEADTGVVVEEETFIYIARTALGFQHIEYPKYAKPDLPFSYVISAKFPNGQPAAYEPVTACFRKVCRNFTTDESGLLRVVCPPFPTDDYPPLEVRAVNYPEVTSDSSRRPIMYESGSSFYIQGYYSPSNSSLLISPDSRNFICTPGETVDITLPVLYAAQGVTQATLYVEAISRGQIQFWKSVEVQFTPTDLPFAEDELLSPIEAPASSSTVRGAFDLTLELPPSVSSTVHVLIWYARPDGEVVSDEQTLQISPCLNYAVELSWSAETAEQGSELPLTLTAQPDSLCSLGIVDKSVELLSAPQSSLLQEIFQLVEQADIQYWENSQINDYAYCSSMNPEPPLEPTILEEDEELAVLSARKEGSARSSIPFPGYGYGYYTELADAIKMFDLAGVYVFSDLTLETRPCEGYSNGYYPGMFPDESALLSAVDGGDAAVGGLLSRPSAGQPESGSPLQNAITSTDDSPDVETRTYFPETWLWELQTLPDTGVYSESRTLPDTITEWVGRAVCVHPDKGVGISAPTSITTFTSFFIDLTLPPSVKVGEILPVKISVFNYINTSLPVRVTLEESPEYEILEGNTTEAAADQATAGQRSACVPAQDKETVVVRIRPLTAGSVAINVTAVVDAAYADPCGSGVVPNKIDRISKPITVNYEGFPREVTWTKFICSTDVNGTEWYLEAPSGIVNNSVRAWVTVAGDLLGPTLDNLGHLIQMPYGCGEQNMISFTPNIYVLQYLIATDQDNPEVTERLLTYMKSGYQRELTYKRDDGSYSCFGNGDESGSTWLTAFVLKSYAQSAPYIEVDIDELIASVGFLSDLQLSSGCFESVGTVHNKRMKGGVADSTSPAALTAYVMAALLEAGAEASSLLISGAATCIDAATAAGAEGEDDVYLLALKAYAYSLAGLSQTEAVINDLLSRAIETPEGIYWDMNSLNGLYSDALSVETASYVLLAMLNSDVPDPQGKRLLIVKWISSRRNGQGGFVSTQDTVLALQALALYASYFSQGPQNLTVTVTGESLDVEFQVTSSNKLVSQRADVDVVPNNVTVDLAGSGCALVQAVVRYNVPDPDLSEVFALRVSNYVDYSNTRCPAHTIEICATYLLNDGESNMGIIETNLVSGYVPQIEDLERIVQDVTGAIKRYEVEDGKVQFYIDQFTDTETCVEFTAYQETEVEDVKPGTVRIYDYYEPDFFISETFTFNRRTCRN